jgi:hypothetical protein
MTRCATGAGFEILTEFFHLKDIFITQIVPKYANKETITIYSLRSEITVRKSLCYVSDSYF